MSDALVSERSGPSRPASRTRHRPSCDHFAAVVAMQAVHAEAGLLVEASAAEEEPAGRVVGNVLPQLAEDVATQLTDLVVAVEKHDVLDLARRTFFSLA